MSGDLEAIIPVPGRRHVWTGWEPILFGLICLVGFPFLLGWGLGGKQPMGWGVWALYAFILVSSVRNLLQGVSRLAAEPTALLIRSSVVQVQRRGSSWSMWVAPPDQLIARDAVEFLQGYGKLMLSDKVARTASLVLAEGKPVGPLASLLASNGFEVQTYGVEA